MAQRASSSFLRALLRSIYAGAQAVLPTPQDLKEALEAALVAGVQETSTGKVLVGAGANGTTATYQIPGGGYSLGPVDIAEAVEYLLRKYDTVVATLTTPTDLEIRDAMLAAIQSTRRPGVSFENFRL